MLKIGVICVHRGDRPEFLAQFKKYMSTQTLRPDKVLYVDYEPMSNEIDITARYRFGYEWMSSNGYDVALLCEVDDFYASDYIEIMVAGWEDNRRPQLLTLSASYYYHITGRWFRIDRPSANTFLLRAGLQISWGVDSYPYVDVALIGQLQVGTFQSPSPICIGIKHGIGLVGGGCHNSDNERYTQLDEGGDWLRAIVGDENYEFYKSLKKRC